MVMLKKMRPLNKAIITVEYDPKTKTSVLVADVDTHFWKTKPISGRYSVKSAKRIWNGNQRHLFSEIVGK